MKFSVFTSAWNYLCSPHGPLFCGHKILRKTKLPFFNSSKFVNPTAVKWKIRANFELSFNIRKRSSSYGQVAGTCECGNQPSGSIKGGGISRLAENRLASQEGLCSTE